MLSGLPIIYGINPYSSETTPSHSLGAVGFTSDGRRFRYVRNNATNAMVAGELQQSQVEDTGEQALSVAAAAIGATQVTTTSTVTVTANEYAEGYIVATVTGAGLGRYYKIKSHPAATAAVVTFTLYDPIETAFTATTDIDVVPNPYDLVLQYATGLTGIPVGVAMTAVPASSYAWVQSGGPGVCLADASGAVTVGTKVTVSNQTAGCIEDADSDTQPVVGVALTGIAQAEYGMVNLMLD